VQSALPGICQIKAQLTQARQGKVIFVCGLSTTQMCGVARPELRAASQAPMVFGLRPDLLPTTTAAADDEGTGIGPRKCVDFTPLQARPRRA
jgi:hypothetical protein